MPNPMDEQVKTTNLAETANFIAWQAEEPDGETTYHLQLGGITVHFFQEEWDEFKALVSNLS